MKLLLLAAFFGGALAMEDDDVCLDKEFKATGYYTGQNIDMNYEDSEIRLNGGGDTTLLHLEFFVPKRYIEQYEANAFALTFNRARGAEPTYPSEDEDGNSFEDFQKQTEMFIDQTNDDQTACYSNRYDNYTYCTDRAAADALWTTDEVNADNPCIYDVSADIPWADVMGTAFTGKELQYNGNWIEIFLTATVETWTHFREGVTGGDYLGVMTGGEGWQNTDVTDGDKNRKGTYENDAGWKGWPEDPAAGEFGDIVMDDERYTLYQIPFIIRFPRTVMVETSFKAAQKITLLTGVVAQDVIQVNLNPRAGVFATVEAVLTTQVQYPYGIRSPDDNVAPMTIVIGGTVDGGGTHAEGAEFIEFDHEGACMHADQYFKDEGTCEQSFKFRLTPTAANPCNVAGEYTFELWAKCVGKDEADMNGCAIDDLVDNGDVVEQRKSNSYFTHTITIAHQDFCPEVMDEVRVVGDFRVFKDEQFELEIDNDANEAETNVYTNDQLYYEATYRTASLKSGEAGNVNDNGEDDGEYGDDSIIDYVRPTKIFLDVTLGQTRGGAATDAYDGWNADNWNANMDFQPLGGTRIPGTDIAGDDIEVTVGADGDGKGDVAKYQILLCEVPEVIADKIQWENEKPALCFTDTKETAREYLDFTQVIRAKDGHTNEIDENEVAFNMRMDERIFPVGPNSDESFVTVTIEAEIYYIGNRHPTNKKLEETRRRLQENAPPAALNRQQNHRMTVGYPITHHKALDTCTVANNQEHGVVKLTFQYGEDEAIPTAGDMSNFVATMSMQIDEYLHVRGAVTIEKVERCTGNCRLIYARTTQGHAHRRRLEDDDPKGLVVFLRFQSVTHNKAGQIINVFQAKVVNKRSGMHERVTVFGDATVVEMAVDGCNGADFGMKPRGPGRDQNNLDGMYDLIKEDASSAFRPATLLSLALTLLYLAW